MNISFKMNHVDSSRNPNKRGCAKSLTHPLFLNDILIDDFYRALRAVGHCLAYQVDARLRLAHAMTGKPPLTHKGIGTL